MAKPSETTAPAEAAPYQVVARRFRPKLFSEVVGQEEVLQSLRTALGQKRIPHAFLFAGSRGVGKTTLARILARCLNCEKGPTAEPCGKCELCVSILDGSNTDVVEIDAASHNGVDDVRALREHVGYASMRSRYRVFILDEAHMLTKSACNALLKTLEEPPPNVVFVLATTEALKLPETIRSRCQLLQFRRVGDTDIIARLRMIASSEGVAMPDEVLQDIAAGSRGGMRDSETALERALSLARDLGKDFDLAAWRRTVQRVGLDRSVEVVAALLAGNASSALQFASELQLGGLDEREALGEVIDALRWILLLSVDGDDSGLVPVSGVVRQTLIACKQKSKPHQLDAMLQAGLVGRERLRRLEDRGVVLELTFVRMAQAGAMPTLGELLAEVRGGGLANAAPAPAAPRPAMPMAGVPQAGASAPVAAGGDLRSAVLARAQQSGPMLAATVEQCRIDGPDAQGKVVVQLLTDRKMHIDRLQAPALQQQIAGWLQEAAGRQLQIEFRLGAPATSPNAGAAAQAAAVNTPPPAATQRIVGKFGGRVVAVNPTDAIRQDAPPAAEPEPPVADEPES